MHYSKKLLSLLGILSMLGLSDYLQASSSLKSSKSAPKPTVKSKLPAKPTVSTKPTSNQSNVIDLSEVMTASKPYNSVNLLNIHDQAMKQNPPKSLYSSFLKSNKKAIPEPIHEDSVNMTIDDTPNSSSENSSLNAVAQSQKVTPAAYLKTVLDEKFTEADAFKNFSRQIVYNEKFDNAHNHKYYYAYHRDYDVDVFLNKFSTDKNYIANDYDIAFDDLTRQAIIYEDDPAKQQLIRQAKTLLVRARPEVVKNSFIKLSYLPNRFMSYFKEKMPTLSTAAGKQRFTQSVMMETLKNMPDIEAISKFDSNVFKDKLTKITNKYASNLNPTDTQMFGQWSRNLIAELALLAPRTAGIAGKAAAIATGTAVGAGAGAAGGALIGAVATAALPVATAIAVPTAAGFASDYFITGGKNNERVIKFAKDTLINNIPDSTIKIPDLPTIEMPTIDLKDVKEYIRQIDPKSTSQDGSLGLTHEPLVSLVDRNKIKVNIPKNVDLSSRSYPQAALDTVTGVAAGAAAGTYATLLGITTTAIASPLATTTGAIPGAYIGAQLGGKAFDAASKAVTSAAQSATNSAYNASRAAYNKGAQLFTPKSNVTQANLNGHNNEPVF